MTSHASPTRRAVLGGAASVAVLPVLLPRSALAAMDVAIREFTRNAEARPGRVRLDLPPLVENGNLVPLGVAVDSPMTEEAFVRRIGVFNERNPQPNVAVFHLSPHSGRAAVSTRVRLADTQRIVAVAELSDGSFWSAEAEVIVTLAACVES